jgi:hypothetical protein
MGRCPRTLGPPSGMGSNDSGPSPRPDRQALPRNPQGRKGSLRSTLRADPCDPGRTCAPSSKTSGRTRSRNGRRSAQDQTCRC